MTGGCSVAGDLTAVQIHGSTRGVDSTGSGCGVAGDLAAVHIQHRLTLDNDRTAGGGVGVAGDLNVVKVDHSIGTAAVKHEGSSLKAGDLAGSCVTISQSQLSSVSEVECTGLSVGLGSLHGVAVQAQSDADTAQTGTVRNGHIGGQVVLTCLVRELVGVAPLHILFQCMVSTSFVTLDTVGMDIGRSQNQLAILDGDNQALGIRSEIALYCLGIGQHIGDLRASLACHADVSIGIQIRNGQALAFP